MKFVLYVCKNNKIKEKNNAIQIHTEYEYIEYVFEKHGVMFS